jgi:hypothetical protein
MTGSVCRFAGGASAGLLLFALASFDARAVAAIGPPPSIASPPTLAPAEYFALRRRAEGLLHSKDAAAALAALDSLAQAYPEDGSSWLRLANGALAAKRYPRAIEAYRRALELGWGRGFSVRFNIACAYALDGAPDSAFAWLERSLATGLENRPLIGEDEDLASLRSDPRFPALLGRPPAEPRNRDDGWRHDLRFLQSEIARLHVNVGQSAPRESLDAAFDALDARVPSVPDHLMPFELQRIVRRLGDGHSVVLPMSDRTRPPALPLRFYWFPDGLYVVDAVDQHRDLIGARVVSIGRGRAESFVRDLEPIVTRDNPMGILSLGPFYLTFAPVLQGLGYLDTPDVVPMTLEGPAGKRREVRITPGRMQHWGPMTAPAGAGDPPIWLRNANLPYWMEALSGDSALYVQVNQVRNGEGETLAQFSRRLRDRAARGDVARVIVDLRHNNGGNSFLNDDLVRALVHFRQSREDARLLVLIGRTTFSAAMNLTTDLERWTDPIFIGEPTGSRPNVVGEGTNVILPYSGAKTSIASRYHQESYPGDDRIWIPPHVPVALSSKDYFSNRDPVLDAARLLGR